MSVINTNDYLDSVVFIGNEEGYGVLKLDAEYTDGVCL